MEGELVVWRVMGLYWWLLIVLSNSLGKMSKISFIYYNYNYVFGSLKATRRNKGVINPIRGLCN